MATDPQLVAMLEGATHRLVRTVDRLSDADWTAPSRLPGWDRAHVVAHLTLNAEGLSAAVEGVHEGQPVPMYPSQEERDADIVALSRQEPATLRDRFLASTTVIDEWVAELADNLTDRLIERTPGGRTFAAGDVGDMRLREVEIHHVDLDGGYTVADWPEEFVTLLLTSSAAMRDSTGFMAYAVDLDRRWTFGEGGPTVTGPARALAWWTTGRGSGEGLTSDDGVLPRIEAW